MCWVFKCWLFLSWGAFVDFLGTPDRCSNPAAFPDVDNDGTLLLASLPGLCLEPTPQPLIAEFRSPEQAGLSGARQDNCKSGNFAVPGSPKKNRQLTGDCPLCFPLSSTHC